MLVLKQSTGIDVRVGPFVDATNGVTPETVTFASTDQCELLKANGAATVDISAATWTAVTGCAGWYDLTLTTSHTDTVGELVIVVQDESLCLPVFVRAQVVEESVYDQLFASGGAFPTNFGDLSITATTGRVDVAAVAGTAQTANDNGADINAVLADTNELQTDWANGGRLDTILDARAAEATVAALNDVSTAEVNAEVVDALSVDTISQLSQGAPTATPTLEEAIMYLYTEYVRNKVVVDTNTANQKQIFADGGSTILYEKDLTNASNVTTVAEATTGA